MADTQLENLKTALRQELRVTAKLRREISYLNSAIERQRTAFSKDGNLARRWRECEALRAKVAKLEAKA